MDILQVPEVAHSATVEAYFPLTADQSKSFHDAILRQKQRITDIAAWPVLCLFLCVYLFIFITNERPISTFSLNPLLGGGYDKHVWTCRLSDL